jgi:hypothetical protein
MTRRDDEPERMHLAVSSAQRIVPEIDEVMRNLEASSTGQRPELWREWWVEYKRRGGVNSFCAVLLERIVAKI